MKRLSPKQKAEQLTRRYGLNESIVSIQTYACYGVTNKYWNKVLLELKCLAEQPRSNRIEQDAAQGPDKPSPPFTPPCETTRKAIDRGLDELRDAIRQVPDFIITFE